MQNTIAHETKWTVLWNCRIIFHKLVWFILLGVNMEVRGVPP